MSEPLRQLIDSSAFLILHENLEKWSRLYNKNTCDENIATGCEIIELNARLQGQLFRLISICASEGGIYGGAAAIKSRLLPLLGSGFFSSGLTSSTSLSVLASASAKSMELEGLRRSYDKSLRKLEMDLGATYKENSRLRTELENAREVLEREMKGTVRENDPGENKSKLLTVADDSPRISSKYSPADMSDHESRRSYPSHSTTRKGTTRNFDLYDSDVAGYSLPSRVGPISPLSLNDPIQRNRQQLLVMQYNDLFSNGRAEAMRLLRRHSSDQDMNQLIVFQALLEAFSVAKSRFRAYRNRVRTKLASSTNAPSAESLEELVQSHVNVHASHAADIPAMSQEVLFGLERHTRLKRPASALGYDVIIDFIHEACRLAWNCTILAHPLDVYRPACANEVFDDAKYRRSHDSSYNSVLIHHHIWPCLIQDGNIVAKGEACTKRGRSTVNGRQTIPQSHLLLISAHILVPQLEDRHLPDPISKTKMSNVVYELRCKDCNRTYAGETMRELNVKEAEHKRKASKPPRDTYDYQRLLWDSAIAGHAIYTRHSIDFDNVKEAGEPVVTHRTSSVQKPYAKLWATPYVRSRVVYFFSVSFERRTKKQPRFPIVEHISQSCWTHRCLKKSKESYLDPVADDKPVANAVE
ncbi:unnamed protein product [Calicophoron daubneyi]|uniref:Mitochondria-eating protein n=1 Tax=Calicophoron daubneyi TaxID=300641 RepID=A0AAV2THG2_CALDB